jgi:hypothetical protein
MRTRTPPLAPKLTDNVTVHIVLNDFGEKLGRAFLETDEAEADEFTIVSKIITGEYSNPARVVAFNIAEGWSRDVTDDIAQAVIERGNLSRRHWGNRSIRTRGHWQATGLQQAAGGAAECGIDDAFVRSS